MSEFTPLSESERVLVAALLRLASNTFVSHSSNDFDMSIIPEEDRKQILRAVEEWNGTPEEFDETQTAWSYDWVLMNYFADRIYKEEKTHE